MHRNHVSSNECDKLPEMQKLQKQPEKLPFYKRSGQINHKLAIKMKTKQLYQFEKKCQSRENTGSASTGLPNQPANASMKCLLTSINETASRTYVQSIFILIQTKNNNLFEALKSAY